MRIDKKGFTLVELIVVVLLVGIMTAMAVPQYLKSVETSKAEDAVAQLKMVGTTNRMYALDNNNVFAAGTITSDCNTATCEAAGAACSLVGCKYLAYQDWSAKPYQIVAANGTSTAVCDGVTYPSAAQIVACVKRKTSGSAGTTIAPYSTWGYAIDITGTIQTYGSAPNPSGL